jgi:hypothetical protein
MTDHFIEPPRPPAPVPLDAPLGPFSTMLALRRNPIETWTKAHFELPIVVGPTILGPDRRRQRSRGDPPR